LLIKSAGDKSKRLALQQDLLQSLTAKGAAPFLRDRRYALKLIFHYPCQSKSAIL